MFASPTTRDHIGAGHVVPGWSTVKALSIMQSLPGDIDHFAGGLVRELGLKHYEGSIILGHHGYRRSVFCGDVDRCKAAI